MTLLDSSVCFEHNADRPRYWPCDCDGAFRRTPDCVAGGVDVRTLTRAV
jgi:hypothetical protein